MLSYFAIAVVLTCATHAWFARRLVHASDLPATWRRGTLALLLMNAACLPFALVVSVVAPASSASWAVPLGRAAFVDEGFCLLLAATLAARDALWVPAAAALRRSARGPELGRRRVLWMLRGSGAAAVGVAAAATAVGHRRALTKPEVRRLTLRIPGLAQGLRGLRMVQISDLHVGPTIRRDAVAAVVDAVNDLAPELVVITGDLVDGFVDQLSLELAPLAALRAPLGCFFVTGNHEYFYRADEWVTHLRGLGCTVLLNEHRVLSRRGGSLLIAGVCDESGSKHSAGHAQDLSAALSGAPAADARVLLAHRPDCAPRAASMGFDLQLSGHLHGGQMFPLSFILRAVERHLAGLYRVGGMHLYVSRGVGYWGPSVRLGSDPEIGLFELDT